MADESEIFWAGAWAFVHVAGFAIMLVLRRRSARQVRVAEDWQRHVPPSDQQEADDLVVLTRDRHRRNTALVIVAVSYLLLGAIVLASTIYPWLDTWVYRTLTRAILTAGEVVWVGSAWLSVTTGDRIAHAKTFSTRRSGEP